MTLSLLCRASQVFSKPVSRSLAVQSHSSQRLLRFQSSAATATKEDTDVEEGKESQAQSFKSLKDAISRPTLEAITTFPLKLRNMTPVQQKVLSLLPELAYPYSPESDTPRDLLVRAKTGTGKTVAFLVPAIEARRKELDAVGRQAVIDTGRNSDKELEVRAKRKYAREAVGTLILSPTRELATQIANEAIKLTHHHPDMNVCLFTGGTNKRLQMRDWMKGSRDIVVATTGRLRDMIESEPEVKSGLKQTKVLILDEADTMLDMGFRDDIEAIRSILPPSPLRQTLMFSATVPSKVRQVAATILAKGHEYIDCVPSDDSPVHAHIPQYHTVLPSAAHQVPHIMRLIAHDQLTNGGNSKVVVFLPTTKMTQLFSTIIRNLSRELLPSGRSTNVFEIHSKRAMESRVKTSSLFRQAKKGANILVTSDVSARGVDYPGVTRVIQVGIPASAEQYVHRIGRTGRAGTSGRADIVLLPWEIGFITWQLTEMPIKPLTVSELQNQLKDLAENVDKSDSSDSMEIKPFAPVLPEFESMARELTGMFDGQAVRETFLSLIGYYFAKSPELRVEKNVILEGCKAWTVEAGGQSVPPFVSERFLAQLGLTDGRTRYFGQSRVQHVSKSNSSAPWSGRGQQRLKGRVRQVERVDYNDPDVQEYRGHRYNMEHKARRYGSPYRKQRDTTDEGRRYSRSYREQRDSADDERRYSWSQREQSGAPGEGRRRSWSSREQSDTADEGRRRSWSSREQSD